MALVNLTSFRAEPPMDSQPSNNDDTRRKLIQSGRCDGDSKSVFELLLRIERELLSKAKGDRLPLAKLGEKAAAIRPPRKLFRSYLE